MDEVERRLGTLTRKKEQVEKGHSILESYDQNEREEVQERGELPFSCILGGGCETH